MARNFVSASSTKLSLASAPVTAAGFSVHCQWRPVSLASQQRPINISDGSTNNSFSLEQDTSGHMRAKVEAGGTNSFAATAAVLTAGAYNFLCAVFASIASRSVYTAGGNKITDTTSKTPSGLNQLAIGNGCDGDIAEMAIWNAALADADVAALAGGTPPWLVRPDALFRYWPLLHGFSPEIELIKGDNLTVTGATVSAHPPMRYRSAR